MNLKSLILIGSLAVIKSTPVAALPPPEDIPEEVLRTQIITEGRSPVDGRLLPPEEYAELQAQLRESPFPPQLDPTIQEKIFLLELLRFIRIVTPF